MKKLHRYLLFVCLLGLSSQAVADDDYYRCDAEEGCSFAISPGCGRHVNLYNIKKGRTLRCEIKGFAAVGHIDYSHAAEIEMKITLETLSRELQVMTLNAQQLKVEYGEAFFDMENTSDIPYNESIYCIKW